MSDTPRTDAYEAEYNAWCRYAEQHKNIPEALDQCPLEDDPIGMMRKFERELAEMKAKYAAECDASMMAGSQNSALRLQLRDAEERPRARSATRDTERLDHIEQTKCYPFWNGDEWIYIVAPERSSKSTARGRGKTVREAIDAAADSGA